MKMDVVGLTVGSLIVVFGLRPSPGIPNVSPASNPVVLEESWLPPPALIQGQNCADCKIKLCGHEAPANELGEIANPHAFCLPNADCSGHPDCIHSFLPRWPSTDAVRFPQLVNQATDGNRDAVRILLKDYPLLVTLNKERQSVQLRGCDRTSIIANIRLDDMTFGALVEREGRGITGY